MIEVELAEINGLIRSTDHWGMVGTPYGRMYLAGNDDGIALRYYHNKGYEDSSLALWYRLCKGAECVADVGAHTGIYSLAAYSAGAKRVISVEPYWLNASRLVLNLRANGYPTSGVRYMAAGSWDGITGVTNGGNWPIGYCSAGMRIDPSTTKSVVITKTLDKIIGDWPMPTVVKIDVEGYTDNVLFGMRKILESTPDLIFERDKTEVESILEGHGYTLRSIDEDKGLLVFLDPSPSINRRNCYATVRP